MRKNTIEKKAKELNLTTIEVSTNQIEGSHEEVEQLMEALNIQWGGYTTGYGSLVVRKGYESLGDWNDSSSRHHY
jgi:hypothetical protein